MTFACCFCFSLHLRSALDTLLLVLLMVLSGYLMFALLIGKYSSIYILCPLASIPRKCYICPIQCLPSSFIFVNLYHFFILNILFPYCRLIYMARPHAPRTEKVVSIGFQPGFDPYKVCTTTSLHCYVFYPQLLKQLWACSKLYKAPFSIIYGITDCKCISSWRHSVSRC